LPCSATSSAACSPAGSRAEVQALSGSATPPLAHLVPRLHVVPERGWLNDPNGPAQHRGRHHLFFQEHPHAVAWGPPQWGHVSSADLVTWRRHPPALVPSAHGPDRDGCWSGCLRVIDGRPTLFYTGVTGSTDADRVESVCTATALDDDLDRWEVDPNPSITPPPLTSPLLTSTLGTSEGGTGFARDPFVWHDDQGWHLLLGVAGGVDHHLSPDARAWTRTGTFYADDAIGGRHLECPQLLRMPDADVLVLSVQAGTHEQPRLHVVHVVGRACGGRFTGTVAGPLEHGDALYAPAVTQEPSGRWLLWGWLRELVPDAELAALGRAGALSLPMACALESGRLVLQPVAELEALRNAALRVGALPRQAEITATLGGGGTMELRLSPDGAEAVVASYDGTAVLLDRSRSSTAAWAPTSSLRVPVSGRGPVRVRLLLDGSVLVLCVEGVVGAVTRVYPTSPVCGDLVPSGDVRDLRLWRLGQA